MKSITLLCAALGCLLLSGCVVHDRGRGGPHVGKTKVVVPVPVVVQSGKPGKCPPGQAKKGNC